MPNSLSQWMNLSKKFPVGANECENYRSYRLCLSWEVDSSYENFFFLRIPRFLGTEGGKEGVDEFSFQHAAVGGWMDGGWMVGRSAVSVGFIVVFRL